MVALLKHCCCNYYTYRFSYDEILIPLFNSQSISFDTVDNRPVRINRVPFYYAPNVGDRAYFLYLYKDGVVLDFQNDYFATMPFKLKLFSKNLINGFSLQLPFSFFTSCLYFCSEVINNCISADLELRAKIIDFVNSVDISSFLVDEYRVNSSALLAHFRTFPYKIHLKFDCDVIHTNEYFPNSKTLYPNQILNVKNVNFEVSII